MDGTKLRANASKDANREVPDLEAQVAAWFVEAVERVFGESPQTFYKKFEQYRSTLR